MNKNIQDVFYHTLDKFNDLTEEAPKHPFNRDKHDRESRLTITKIFLIGYFLLIGGGFLFCILYNFSAAYINLHESSNDLIKYLNISNTISIITNTLSTGLGFVIGFYFKNKTEHS